MYDELVVCRRHIHVNAECGLELPKTVDYVSEKLESYGIEYQELGGGIVATLGSGAPVLMLRADMDALPQEEQSGLEFACTDGACHSCGHDFHTTQLIGAAKILKRHEAELKGMVKLVFQPGEETLMGSKQMVDAGVMENPHVDAVMGIHMNFGPCGYDPKTGIVSYTTAMASADEFKIKIKGVATHGSTPFIGRSPISAAANIITSVQQLLTLEVSCEDPTVISFGKISGGVASNAIPEEVELWGNIRTFSRVNRNRFKKRLVELVESVAAAWETKAELEFTVGVGPVENDPAMLEEIVGYCEDVAEEIIKIPPVKGSEDFSYFCEFAPVAYIQVGAGGPSDGHDYSMHNPKAVIDEEALPYGVAVWCNCATKWLANHSQK